MGEDIARDIVALRDYLQTRIELQDCFHAGSGSDRRALAAFERIVADRRALAQGNAWRPIETAPKDGTKILVWIPQAAWEPSLRPCACAVHWNTSWESWEDTAMVDLTDHAGLDDWLPSHWQPLPSAPDAEIARAQTQGEGEG